MSDMAQARVTFIRKDNYLRGRSRLCELAARDIIDFFSILFTGFDQTQIRDTQYAIITFSAQARYSFSPSV